MFIKRLLTLLLFALSCCYMTLATAVHSENKTGFIEQYKMGKPLIKPRIKAYLLDIGHVFLDEVYQSLEKEAENVCEELQGAGFSEITEEWMVNLKKNGIRLIYQL